VAAQPARQVLDAVAVLGLGQGVVLLCGLATVKVLALIAGPVAVGAFALVRSAQQTGTIMGSFGGDNWIVQGIAARAGRETQADFIRAAWWLLTTSALLAYVLSAPLSVARPIFETSSLYEVFSPATLNLTALAVSLGILLVYYRSQLLARLRIGKVSLVNASSSLTALALAYPVAHFMSTGRFEWAAILVLASLGVGLATAWAFCRGLGIGMEARELFRKPTQVAMADSLRIAGPTLGIFAVGAITIFSMRALVTERFGIAIGGIFDTAWTLSTVGLGLLLTTISNYLLPATARASSPEERMPLFEAALRITILIAVPMIVFVISAKGWLIRLLYTSEFLPATEILRWMLLGDFLKTSAWMVATLGYARGHILAYGIVETIWGLTVVVVSLALVQWTGTVESFGIGYFVGYVCYAACWAAYAGYRGLATVSTSTIRLWVAGLLVVSVSSAWTWGVPQVGVGEVALILSVVAFFCLAFSSTSERIAIRDLVVRLIRTSARER
jgi:O-antigen/teichoic acid export membrane protein